MTRRKQEPESTKRPERGEMHLSATAEYALRAMTYLATLPAGASARASDLEAATHASAPYLTKVLRRLVVAGLLVSQKGHHGGFSLAKPPARIRFLDVLEAVREAVEPEAPARERARADERRTREGAADLRLELQHLSLIHI